ncbi:hypothetical protein ACU4GD_28385 [Cupriavidus basilensis]
MREMLTLQPALRTRVLKLNRQLEKLVGEAKKAWRAGPVAASTT